MTASSVLQTAPTAVQAILNRALHGERLSTEDARVLYYEADLGLLASVANTIRERLHGNKTYFNRNFHIEPTNKCVFDCTFCSYSRNFQPNEASWEMSKEQMIGIVKKYVGTDATEVHIVGGVHPKMSLLFFADLVKSIREVHPTIHIKGFTAVELEYMFRKAKVTVREGLEVLKTHGLQSLPGGGAEIFDASIRNEICKDKASAAQWLEIHETAHQLDMHSNCTMLYGHIERYEHRIDHMNRLRDLQDRTHGFNCFIPLKFRNKDNEMSHIPEVTIQEDLRTYAMARIFMDNIPHLKAYWPMIGRNTAQLLLSFGVDDLDGTIDDSTKIYAMAGSEEQNPSLSTADLVRLIKQVNRIPMERDSLYNELKDYSNERFPDEPAVQQYN